MMALNGIAANTMLQLQAPDHLRGRVMGFYSFVVLGMAPFGLAAGRLGRRSTSGCGWRSRSGGLVCLVVAGAVAGGCGTSGRWAVEAVSGRRRAAGGGGVRQELVAEPVRGTTLPESS